MRWRSISLDEEGVAVGLPVDGVGQLQALLGQVVAGRRLQVLDHLVVVEALQGDAADPGLPAQRPEGLGQRVGRGQLGVSVGADDEQPQGVGLLHQVAQQLQAGRVGPLQVVEHEHHGTLLAGRGQDAEHRGVQQVALGLGVGPLARRGQSLHPGAQGPAEPGQLGPVGGHVGGEHLLGGVGDVVVEGLGEGGVGHAELLVAAAEQHDGPLGVGPPGRLGGQGGLALPGLPGDQDHLAALVAGHPLVGLLHRHEVQVAADHRPASAR